jgi:hypothetical protein
MSNLNAILKDRKNTHGPFRQYAKAAQTLKKAISGYEPGPGHLSSVQREGLDMICGKIARIVTGDPDHVDHWEDIAGYATRVAEDLRGPSNE